MQWFTQFELALEALCYSRQHEAPIEGRTVTPRQNGDSTDELPYWPNREFLGFVRAAAFLDFIGFRLIPVTIRAEYSMIGFEAWPAWSLSIRNDEE